MQAIELPLPPKELREVSSPLEYKKTQAYQREKWWFGLIQGAFSFLLSTSLLYFFYLPWLWATSSEAVSRLGMSGEIKARLPARGSGKHPIDTQLALTKMVVPQVSVAFFLIDSLKDLVIGLPWSLWSIFVIEQRHGFNKQTPLLFLTDQLKQVRSEYRDEGHGNMRAAGDWLLFPEECSCCLRRRSACRWCSYRRLLRGSPGFC